jgi:hypothetical protein
MSLILRSVLMLLLSTSILSAVEFIIKDVNRDDNKTSTWIALPYAFSSAATGFTAGVAAIFHGFLQPQMTMVVTGFRGEKLPVEEVTKTGVVSDSEAYSQGGFIGITGVRIPYTERFFVSYLGMRAYYPNQRLYLDGSNESVQDLEPSPGTLHPSPLQTQGWSNWSYIDLRYVLPIGESKDQVLPIIETSRGIAVNRDNIGGGTPFVTGQTIASLKPFYNLFTADKLQPESPQLATNGLKFIFSHDNTDYPDNPLRGYSFSFQYAHDFGYGSSTQKWNSLEAEYSHYIELPKASWMRHDVLAFNVWSAYSPSWDKDKPYIFEGGDEAENIDQGQPPMWEGARLGGWDRMRAYDSSRFNDKAAIYGAVEYRFIPQLNPMQDQKWSPIPIDWFQGVLFAEAGRVAPQYNLDLFKDMKYDVGFSVRALAATLPVRFEMAWGSEGSTMWVMLKQPF